MIISLKHAFPSGKGDGLDASLVQPPNWNEEHEMTMAEGKVLCRALPARNGLPTSSELEEQGFRADAWPARPTDLKGLV